MAALFRTPSAKRVGNDWPAQCQPHTHQGLPLPHAPPGPVSRCCSARENARAREILICRSPPREARMRCDVPSCQYRASPRRNGRSAWPGTRCSGLPAARGGRETPHRYAVRRDVEGSNGELRGVSGRGAAWSCTSDAAMPDSQHQLDRLFFPHPQNGGPPHLVSARLAAADLVSLGSCTDPSLTTLHPAGARILYIQTRRIPPPSPPLPLSGLITQAP